MTICPSVQRPLGTMIVYGFPRLDLAIDLAIVQRLDAKLLEILPYWPAYPDAQAIRERVEALGLKIHSAHGCWGGQSIRADRVDLASTQPNVWSSSLDDLKRCVDWLEAAGGSCLVVHPGGLSDVDHFQSRRDALVRALASLADHASGTGVTVCVENMPPGVFPGSKMDDLNSIVAALDRREIGLALDTGHANIRASVVLETMSAGEWLRTTHVHDNDGRQDSHLPPGLGTIDWEAWVESLDRIDYRGPIVLECIKFLRDKPESLTTQVRERLRLLQGLDG